TYTKYRGQRVPTYDDIVPLLPSYDPLTGQTFTELSQKNRLKGVMESLGLKPEERRYTKGEHRGRSFTIIPMDDEKAATIASEYGLEFNVGSQRPQGSRSRRKQTDSLGTLDAELEAL